MNRDLVPLVLGILSIILIFVPLESSRYAYFPPFVYCLSLYWGPFLIIMAVVSFFLAIGACALGLWGLYRTHEGQRLRLMAGILLGFLGIVAFLATLVESPLIIDFAGPHMFEVPRGAAICENGIINLTIKNTGLCYAIQSPKDITEAKIDGIPLRPGGSENLTTITLNPNDSGLIISYNCTAYCSLVGKPVYGEHAIVIGTSNAVLHPDVICT